MKELTVEEKSAVGGGVLANVAWMIGGYIFGKAVDAAAEIDWGTASSDEINIAP